MIDLYTWMTPNGRKVSIMLEELGEGYEAHAVNLGEGQQHTADFLAISPSGKIPAIRDRESGMTLMESGAILLWLAETRGRFLPTGAERWKTLEWTFWQVAGLGPQLGQAHQVLKYNRGKAPWSEERSREQVARAYATLDTRLRGRDFIAGEGAGTTRSPTSSRGHGSAASSGTRPTSRATPRFAIGISGSQSALPCRRGIISRTT